MVISYLDVFFHKYPKQNVLQYIFENASKKVSTFSRGSDTY